MEIGSRVASPRYALALLLLLRASSALAQLQFDKLTCEYAADPLGIDVLQPRFGWTFIPLGRNQSQSAYELMVSDAADFNSGIQWTSGKVIGSNNSTVEYQGKPLRSLTAYFWKVRTYDQNNRPSPWSKVSSFETAMLHQSDWKAKWIGDGRQQFIRDEEFYQDDRMPLFRKAFSANRDIKRARLYIAGLGYYEAYLNGKKIEDRVLEPGWTSYQKEILYSVLDITSLLKKGINVAGVMLGNGWYNPLPMRLFSRFNVRDFQQTGRPCLKAEFHIQYQDGSAETIITDDSWRVAPGPIIRNNVYLGEQYDARLEQKDWLTPKANEAKWRPAVPVEGPTGNLSVQAQPPIRITKILKPISIKETAPKIFIVDFGQNFAGVARLRVKGKAGTRIKIRYGEAIHPDGTLNFLTTTAGQIKEMWNVSGGPGAPPTAWQEDDYVLKGTGLEEWSPRFTFHGFRYAEISGWPGTPESSSIDGLRMNAAVQENGEFSCSNNLFNKIHHAVKWTFLSNIFSVQSDCPGREKLGYGADMVATANAFMYNFDMNSFYRKAVRDFANDQRSDGGITETAPYIGIGDKGYGGGSGPLGWQLAFPYLQQQLYRYYGDKRIIEENYPMIQKQLAFLQAHAVDGLFHWDIGDHEAIDPKAEGFSAAAFYYHHASLANEFAKIIKHGDSLKYLKLADQIKKEIIRKYDVPGTGRFDNATQSAQLFALWYDLSPEKDKTFQVLMDEFKRHNDHVSSGIFGVKMMFDVLREYNRNDLAYRIASQEDFPGWGYMISQGATTLWETWKYPDNAPSQNHPMFGSIDEWFYRSLLGINSAAPGFEKIIIKPQPTGDLTWAKGSYRSIHGNIESDWKIGAHQFSMNVTIPVNTTAEVWIPSLPKGIIRENGAPITATITLKGYQSGYAVLEIGSGIYSFQSSLP